MPAIYAHYRMGNEALKYLDGHIEKIIRENNELYQIGLHGPDILFYYRPLQSNAVNRLGHKLHDGSGKAFFGRAAETIKARKDPDRYLAYLYGALCHFALDVSCHGDIESTVKTDKISHAEIESELDRDLMVRDGLDPVRHVLTNHIVPSMENAEVISAFYEGVTAAEIKKALEGIISYSGLLLAPSKTKRNFILFALKLSGHYEGMHGMMINLEPNPACAESTARLWTLYQDAVKRVVPMIKEFGSEGWEKAPVYGYTFASHLAEETR